MEQDEAGATPSDSSHVTEDLEVEVEGEDDPLLARGPVSEYPDQQEGGNGPVGGSGLHPSGTPSREPHVHTLAALQATSQQLRDGNKWTQSSRRSESWHPLKRGGVERHSSTVVG